MIFTDKHILLGLCGGIAAYKICELVRLLRKQGADVRVVMTSAATQFITPLTLQALSGHPVLSELLDSETEAAMDHISLARWADIVLIAPATANFIAKLSVGLADDLLSTLCLAAECPVFIAPAMNQAMWRKPVLQENVARLTRYGIKILGPDSGEQACGEVGQGRLLEPEVLFDSIAAFFKSTPIDALSLAGLRFLISAGPTREPLDPVRFISNRSSGKMGFALAIAAAGLGAEVTLVTGPVSLSVPSNMRVIHVETAQQMYDVVIAEATSHQIYIGAAAVADYTPVAVAPRKIKKQAESSSIILQKTKDILAAVAALTEHRPFTVGFAAETHELERYAQAKLIEKNADMIAANHVGDGVGGFDSEYNALTVFWRDKARLCKTHFSMADKLDIAKQLIELIYQQWQDNKNECST